MGSHQPQRKLTAFELRQIAVAALVDPRTVRKALAGHLVQPMTRVRIRAALDEHGLGHLLPPVGTLDGEQP